MRRTQYIWILAFLGCLFVGMREGLAQTNASYNHVVIVLDASSSMNGFMGDIRKMDAAKRALREVVKTIPSATRVGLLVFSAGNTPDDWVYPLGELDQKWLMEAIDLPEARYGTPLGTYMKIGADRLLQERAAQFNYGTYRLLVVTDGEATDGSLTDDYTPLIIARGIKIDVIGVDMDKDHTLATKVHTYRRADDPASLQKALREVLGEIGTERKDAGDDDAFALIEPLSVEVASAAINALSVMENHPIGEDPLKTDFLASNPTPGNAIFTPIVAIVGIAVVVVIIVVLLWH